MNRVDLVKHQPREHAVPCRRCRRRETWAFDAICEGCKRGGPGARVRRISSRVVVGALAVGLVACNPISTVHRLACPHVPSSCHPISRLTP